MSREKKSFSPTMGIPSAFLMGVSAIRVRRRRQFRMRTDLVECIWFRHVIGGGNGGQGPAEMPGAG